MRICVHQSNAGTRNYGGALTYVLVFMAAIFAGIAAWVLLRPGERAVTPVPIQQGSPAAPSLSPATLEVLSRISSPVEVRFYAMLDNPDVPVATKEFAGRVGDLLALYEQEGRSNIKVVTETSMEAPAQRAAQEDGMRAIASEDRTGSYLGIAVVRGDQKVSLPQLATQWEQALEPDITRAIITVTSARAGGGMLPTTVVQEQRSALETARQNVPNLDELSLAEGKKALREASLAELERVAREQQAVVKDAEARLLQAQSGGSEAERKEALEALRAVRQQYTDKLLEISARLQAQTTALEQLKSP